ncbi:hypothetical protein BDV12DRAFT_186302 [Aspergillus spectabilis]
MASREIIELSNTECREYVQIPDGARLPFLLNESGPELGKGGFGTVTRETIATGQFLDMNREPNVGSRVIARKCFNNKIFFDKERVIVTFLQNSRLKHDNILLPLAMISLKSEFSILMNAADCNLEAFLTEEGRMDSTISLKSLLGQVANLAHALNQLHRPTPPDPTIYHLDLTPRNVLVKLSSDSDNPGTWMVSDFGLSRHFRADLNAAAEYGANSVQAEPRVLSVLGRRDTYLPPDAKGGPSSDIWSLGCILCRVVCRKRHGIKGLKVFDELRSKDDPAMNDYFYRGTTVNPYVTGLLNQFCTSGCDMTEGCGSLLRSVLSIDKDMRPEALEFHRALDRIAKAREESTHAAIPLGIQSLQLQIPSDTGQSLVVPGQQLPRHTEPLETGIRLQVTPRIQIDEDTPKGQELEVPVDHNPSPVFLAIENQGADHALIQLRMLFSGSISAYSSIEQYDEGLTPLCHAARKGYTQIVQFLLEKGAHVNERDKRKNTPLMYACREGHCDTAEYLIDQEADWNLQGEDGYTCLHFATEARKIEILDIFIRKRSQVRVKPDANLLSKLDRTPLELHLHRKSQHARYELMKTLISLGANAKAPSCNRNHKTAVQLVLRDDDQQAMKILVTDVDKTWKVSRDDVQDLGAMKGILKKAHRFEG